MSRPYRSAIVVAGIGIGSILWGLLAPDRGQPLWLAAALLPVAILLAVSARLEEGIRLLALFGGAAIGALIALLSHGLVMGFAYLFFLGFADEAIELLEALRLDPELTTALGSPWAILALSEYVLVAPLTEEVGKAIGAISSRPSNRRQAFLSGVAAGTGFAIVENLLYAAFAGVPWNAILLGRLLGTAVHPLATGLVMVGWWEWRQGQGLAALSRRFFAGAGVHALWNGSLVVLMVTEAAFVLRGTEQAFAQVSLVYSAGLGAILGAVLWRVTSSISQERPRLVELELQESSTLGAWAVLSASLLVPVAMLLLAFPDFYWG